MKTWSEIEYTKAVRIKEQTLSYLKAIRGQKSVAGKLDEIILYYIEHHRLNDLIIKKSVKPIEQKERDNWNFLK